MAPLDTRPARPTRGMLFGASALLAVTLLMAAAEGAGPVVVREAQREVQPERAAMRHLTASLAKAVRELVGADKPALRLGAAGLVCTDSGDRLERPRHDRAPRSRPLLRRELLDLPPPPLA